MAATVTLAESLDVDNDTPVYAYLASANYRSAVIGASIANYTPAASGNVLLSIEISPVADPATELWLPVASFAPVAANGPLEPVNVSLFGQQMRLKCTRASGATATFDVAAFAMLRS
jgi:hypothetical protein